MRGTLPELDHIARHSSPMKTAAILLSALLLAQLPFQQITQAKPSLPATPKTQADDSDLPSPQEVQQAAQKITLRITSENNGGSGVLIAKKGDTYLVLTNAHVVKRATKLQIQAPDGQKYTARSIDGGFDAKYDLALLQFTSTTKYALADLSDIASPLAPERTIYSAGFPFDTKNIRITSGQVSQLSDIPFDDGTQIGYTTNRGEKGIRQGMSGGAILDARGKFLGINTLGASPILPNYTYNDGSKPLPKLATRYRQSNWGIPIYNFLTNVKPDILYGYDNLPKVERQVTPTGYLARLNTKARQMTVRIETSGGNGSGVIVAKEGSSYYALTTKHVVQDLDTKQKFTDLQIVAYDQERYGATSTVVTEGADLAVVKFSSNANYPFAKLGRYNLNDNAFAFVGGFPGRSAINSPLWQWQLNPGYIREKEHGKLSVQDDQSFSNGYDLIYSSVSYGGMSGGPVFDRQGNMIGIHGRAESTDKVILGQSLGISIQTFLELASQLQINPQLLWIEKSIPPLITQDDRKMVIAAMQNITQPQESDGGENWLAYGNQLYRTYQSEKSVLAFDKAIVKGKVLTGRYGKALSLRRLGKLPLARISIAEAIATIPPNKRNDYYYFWNYQGYILAGLKEYDLAIASLNIAIGLEPRNLVARNEKANILSNQKKYAAAISVYDEMIRMRPEAYIYRNRGLMKAALKDNQGAINDYNQAIQINPNYANAYNSRGAIKATLKDRKGAIDDYSQAIQINPNYVNAYIGRGMTKTALKDSQGAIRDYDRAIQLDSNNAFAYNERGNAKVALKDNQGAIVDYDRAIRVNPNFANAYVGRGNVKLALKDSQGAILDYNRAIQIDPNLANAYANRGNAELLFGDKRKAILDCDRAIQINPNFAYAHGIRGIAKSKLGDKQGAIVDYDRAIVLDAKSARFYNARGVAKFELGNNSEAIIDTDQAIKLDPNYALAYSNRGFLKVIIGQEQDALPDLNRAIQLDPKTRESYACRGFIKEMLGDKQGAISDYKQAIQVDSRLIQDWKKQAELVRTYSPASYQKYQQMIQKLERGATMSKL
jgi:tetratricopeptide (TPR) repeat protein/S1-C subfamily serine protease